MRYISCIRGGGEGIGSIMWQHIHTLRACTMTPNLKYFFITHEAFGVGHRVPPIEMDCFFNLSKLNNNFASNVITKVDRIIFPNIKFRDLNQVKDNTLVIVRHFQDTPSDKAKENLLKTELKPLLNLRPVNFNTHNTNICFHVRGEDIQEHTHRWVEIELYIQAYEKLKDEYKNSKFYIFGQHRKDLEKLKYFEKKRDVVLEIDKNPFDALSHMILCDVLVAGISVSSFSGLAAFYNSNKIINLIN